MRRYNMYNATNTAWTYKWHLISEQPELLENRITLLAIDAKIKSVLVEKDFLKEWCQAVEKWIVINVELFFCADYRVVQFAERSRRLLLLDEDQYSSYTWCICTMVLLFFFFGYPSVAIVKIPKALTYSIFHQRRLSTSTASDTPELLKMTTAHRPTFDPAKGKANNQAGGTILHTRALPAHTQLKYR